MTLHNRICTTHDTMSHRLEEVILRPPQDLVPQLIVHNLPIRPVQDPCLHKTCTPDDHQHHFKEIVVLQVAMAYREVQVIHPQWPRVEDTEEIMELMEEVVVEEDTMHLLVLVDMGQVAVMECIDAKQTEIL